MKLEIAKLWVKALRSGGYKQGKGFLCVTDNRGRNKEHCCLGVLSELAVKAGVATKEKWSDRIVFDGESHYLPNGVQAWADMKECRVGKTAELMSKNDAGEPFSKIADYIEAHVADL